MHYLPLKITIFIRIISHCTQSLICTKNSYLHTVYPLSSESEYIYNIRTLSVNIKFICTSFRNRQNSEPSASFSDLFRSEYKWILYLTTMYVYCVYPAMSKKSENLSDLNKKDRNKRRMYICTNISEKRNTILPKRLNNIPNEK
jgi:hypothetical protein